MRTKKQNYLSLRNILYKELMGFVDDLKMWGKEEQNNFQSFVLLLGYIFYLLSLKRLSKEYMSRIKSRVLF